MSLGTLKKPCPSGLLHFNFYFFILHLLQLTPNRRGFHDISHCYLLCFQLCCYRILRIGRYCSSTILITPNHRSLMTVYIIIVTHKTGRDIVSIDVYQKLEDAQCREKRAKVNFASTAGFRVHLIKQWASPDLSRTFSQSQ